MRNLILLSFLICCTVYAEEHSFTYKMLDAKHTCKAEGKYEKAYEQCASQCFKRFKKKGMTENEMLRVIDVCANPNSNQDWE